MLCYNCLRAYAEQSSGGKVYAYKDSMGTLKKYQCPFVGCRSYFGYEIVGKAYSPEENMLLLVAAREAFINRNKLHE